MGLVNYPLIWERAALEDIMIHIIGGDWGKEPEYLDEGYLSVFCIRGSEFKDWNNNFGKTAVERKIKASSLEKRELVDGDILVEISGGGPEQPVGRTVLIEKKVLKQLCLPVVGTNFLRLMRPSHDVNSSFVNRYLEFFYKSGEVVKYQGGSNNLRNLKFKEYSAIEIPVPSALEQKFIADKLDILLAQVDSTKVRLEKIPQILKRFRQALLVAAVSGKLTEEWRKQNKISSDWKSVQFLELITKLRSGSGDTPSDNVCGVPILRSSAIRPQIINYEDVRYLSNEETLNEDNYLKNGDLLFTRLSGSADYVGNCALVKGLTKKYQYPDRLFCARLKDQRNANYLEYFCSSNIFREHIIKSIKSSAGHQRITLDAIRTAQIFIPDHLEQNEIVRRVEQLFAYADGIEKQVQNALERVNNLTQSILTKAFRGELTAQWRAENPDLISGENSAQALLVKIQQQRSNTKTIKRSKGDS